jgi:hypothetical protein
MPIARKDVEQAVTHYRKHVEVVGKCGMTCACGKNKKSSKFQEKT